MPHTLSLPESSSPTTTLMQPGKSKRLKEIMAMWPNVAKTQYISIHKLSSFLNCSIFLLFILFASLQNYTMRLYH